MKVIDCFLFFQELDLLEIRLRYLNEIVDQFVIIEAGQTFTGRLKPFVFENNIKRFTQYLPKITYMKIRDCHDSYSSILAHLKRNAHKNRTAALIGQLLETHTHYDKTKIYYALDTYHRECIHFGIQNLSLADNDLVAISDLDEIPSRHALLEFSTGKRYLDKPMVFEQNEYTYFLDYYRSSDWLGTIISPYKTISKISLNTLRIDSKVKRDIVAKSPIRNGGYHFTTCGSIAEIRNKIESWAHQEFNNKYILDNLEKKIQTGQDPFGREVGTLFRQVLVTDARYYDSEMGLIIDNYPQLMSKSSIRFVRPSILKSLLSRLWIKFINQKPFRGLRTSEPSRSLK